jgi:hypothetical protein
MKSCQKEDQEEEEKQEEEEEKIQPKPQLTSNIDNIYILSST